MNYAHKHSGSLRAALILTAMLLLCVPPDAAEGGFVVICPVEDMIDDGVNVLVDRAVREAKDAEAIIFVVDTPGGLLDAGIDITNTIIDAPCHTIAYITGMGAISAGALISYACQDIIFAPATNIGAATPILMSSEGPKPTSEKEVSFMRAKMRALAEHNGHNPSVAEAMVDKDIELRSYVDKQGQRTLFSASPANEHENTDAPSAKDITKGITKAITEVIDTLPEELAPLKEAVKEAIPQEESVDEKPEGTIFSDGTELVLAKGKLLTWTSQEAVDYGLAPTTASSVNEVMAFYGYHGLTKVEIVPTWAESLFRWLTSPMVAGLLMMLGIAGIYMEMKTPGFGVFGIVGVIFLGLFFGSHLIIGLADWVDLLLVVTGYILIAVEIFLLPGFGVAGVSGIVCLLVGLYMSLTRVTIPHYSWDYQRLENMGISMLTAFLSSLLFAWAVWKIFPRTPFYSWLILADAQRAEDGYVVQTEEDEAAVGLKGVARSLLRPAGRARFGDKTYQVVSRGEYIPKGTPVSIIQVEGNRYVVAPMPEEKDTDK